MLTIAGDWADRTWEVGIAFGTVGLRKGSHIFEITTYRSEQYERTSRKPDVHYGKSLEEDLCRRDFTVNAMAVRLPGCAAGARPGSRPSWGSRSRTTYAPP